MSGNLKPPESNNALSSASGQLSEKTESYLNRLLTAKASDIEGLEVIQCLARDLEENPAMIEILFKKITALQGAFPLWVLPELISRIQSKTVTKGIKKALYLLKQKGFEPPLSADQQEKPKGGILKNIEPVQVVGYLSEFDGFKNQMVGLLIPKPAKGRLFIFALINSQRLESLTALEVSKKEVKDMIADLESRSGLVFLGADLSHVAFVLKEAHDRHSQLSPDDEQAYQEIIRHLEGKMMIGQSPIIRTLLDRAGLASYPLDSEWLLEVPEIIYLLPEPSVLESYRQAVLEVQTGILVLNEIQQRERLLGVIEKAVRESFPPAERIGLLRYLEEVAYLYLLKKKPDEAKALFYWAKTLDEEKEPRQNQENPLLLWLMETVLLAETADMTNPAEPKVQTTGGGIILPAWGRREDSR